MGASQKQAVVRRRATSARGGEWSLAFCPEVDGPLTTQRGGPAAFLKPATLRMLAQAMADPMTDVAELCRELEISKQTLYRHLSPRGEMRPAGSKLLQTKAGA
jgi:hypothetical protein